MLALLLIQLHLVVLENSLILILHRIRIQIYFIVECLVLVLVALLAHILHQSVITKLLIDILLLNLIVEANLVVLRVLLSWLVLRLSHALKGL